MTTLTQNVHLVVSRRMYSDAKIVLLDIVGTGEQS